MVVPVRLLFIAVLALVAMGLIANGTLMRRAHVEAGCTVAHLGTGPELQACHAGWFKGFPDLAKQGCTAVGVTARLQYWSCPKG